MSVTRTRSRTRAQRPRSSCSRRRTAMTTSTMYPKCRTVIESRVAWARCYACRLLDRCTAGDRSGHLPAETRQVFQGTAIQIVKAMQDIAFSVDQMSLDQYIDWVVQNPGGSKRSSSRSPARPPCTERSRSWPRCSRRGLPAGRRQRPGWKQVVLDCANSPRHRRFVRCIDSSRAAASLDLPPDSWSSGSDATGGVVTSRRCGGPQRSAG